MRRLAAGLLCLLALAAPAEAVGRYTAPAFSFEVPGGWRATKGAAPDEVRVFAPGSKTEYIGIAARAGGPRSIDAAPGWAKRGVAALGGAPARTAVWDRPLDRTASLTTVVLQAGRGGREYVVSAAYRRPDGDLVIDRHWNVAMAVIVRSWRWSR